MVLCWRTEIHVQFTNYKVQAGISDELQATSNNLQSVDELTRYELTRNGTRMKQMKRMNADFFLF